MSSVAEAIRDSFHGRGGGGGSGFSLGPPQNVFTGASKTAAETARNTYATANSDWLSSYDSSEFILIRLDITGTDSVYQHRINSTWEDVAGVIEGPPGPKGDPGPTYDLFGNTTQLSGAIADDDRVFVGDVTDSSVKYNRFTTFTSRIKNKIGNATNSVAGLLSGADKIKLDSLTAVEGNPSDSANAGNLTKIKIDTSVYNIPTGGGGGGGSGEENVQSDWTETDTNSDAYVKNKPRHVSLPFRTQNAATANPGEIVFYKSDNSEWQSGSSDDIVAVELDQEQCTLQQNPGVDTGTYTAWHNLPDDIVLNGGSTIWTFQRIADSSPFAPIAGTLIIQAETITKNDEENFVLQNLKILQGLNNNFGTGVNWQVVGVFAPPSGADAIIGVLDKSQLPSDTVYAESLVGKETARYASYNNGFIGSGYRTGDFCLFTGTTQPTNARAIGQPDITDGSGVIALGAVLRTDRDPNHFVAAPASVATDYPSGDVLFISVWNKPDVKMIVTLTSAGTLVGTGDAAYIWAQATWDEVVDVSEVTDFGDYFLIDREEPTKIPIEIPYTDILAPPWLLSEPGSLQGSIVPGSYILIQTTQGWGVATIAHLSEHVKPQTTAPRDICFDLEDQCVTMLMTTIWRSQCLKPSRTVSRNSNLPCRIRYRLSAVEI